MGAATTDGGDVRDASDAAASSVQWTLLDPLPPEAGARFHFAVTALPARPGSAVPRESALLIYGGNVSTGLLKLPADCWVFRAGSGWSVLQADGTVDATGHQQPYGRVHSTVVISGEGSLLLFGGESTKPYMYHNSVYKAEGWSALDPQH